MGGEAGASWRTCARREGGTMSDTPDEIELHPAVGECLTRLRADLAASEARCDHLRATAREYLAAEASVAYELADDSDAGNAAAMLARMHAVRTRRDEALARLRALVPP